MMVFFNITIIVMIRLLMRIALQAFVVVDEAADVAGAVAGTLRRARGLRRLVVHVSAPLHEASLHFPCVLLAVYVLVQRSRLSPRRHAGGECCARCCPPLAPRGPPQAHERV